MIHGSQTTSLRRIATGALLLLLAGCAGTRLTHELETYHGRDVHELMARLGSPNGQRETEGDRVYVWSSDSDAVLSATPFATGAAGNDGGMSYAGSSTRGSVIPVKLQCTLEVTVDKHNVIERSEYEGSDAGCRRYRRLLNR